MTSPESFSGSLLSRHFRSASLASRDHVQSSPEQRRLGDIDENVFFSPGVLTAEASTAHADGDYFSSAFATRHRTRRGMTVDEVQSYGIISEEEKSAQFDDIPLSEEDIKSLPRKLRPYYEHLALLHEHYIEVDSILAGELPSTIVGSFRPPRPEYSRLERGKSYTRLMSDLGDEVSGEHDRSSGWARHPSDAWRVRPLKGNDGGRRDDSPDDGGESGEQTPLLAEDRDAKRDRIARLALNVNTIVNILLVGAKAVAVLYSSSISLTASLVDSALDLLSTFIILGTSWAIGVQSDRHKYPAGKRRFEPLGVLIFSVAMIASFVQVFIESCKRVMEPNDQDTVELSTVGMATMLATIGVKSVLWVWCSRIPSSGVQALAQDAENDVYFNIMSLAFPFIGAKIGSHLLDPIGGIVLSLYIIIEWVKTLLQNFANLSGKAASHDQLTRVLYLVSRFNPVLEIADVECYHIGDDLIVEVDVVLPQSASLHFAHDVGETIQCVLENLDGVLRAYVHCDYSSSNPAQHTARAPRPALPQLEFSPPVASTTAAATAAAVAGDAGATSGSLTPTPSHPFGTGPGSLTALATHVPTHE